MNTQLILMFSARTQFCSSQRRGDVEYASRYVNKLIELREKLKERAK